MHGTMGTIQQLKISPAYCVYGGFYSHWLRSDTILFVSLKVAVGCHQLHPCIIIITVYPIISNDCAPWQKKQEACQQASLLAGTDGCFRHNAFALYLVSVVYQQHTFHLVHLTISITIVGEMVNSLKFHDDNTCSYVLQLMDSQ